MRHKDKQGLYFQGKPVANNQKQAFSVIYGNPNISKVIDGFDYSGYSIVDVKGVQHVFELDNDEFMNQLIFM